MKGVCGWRGWGKGGFRGEYRTDEDTCSDEMGPRVQLRSVPPNIAVRAARAGHSLNSALVLRDVWER